MVETPPSSRPGERPKSVTIIAWGVIILGLVNSWRALTLFQQRQLLLNLDAVLDPAVVAVATAIWSTIFIVIATAIFRRKPSIRWLTPIMLFIYALYILLRDWTLAELTNHGNTGFASFSLLIIVFLGLSGISTSFILNRKVARDYFAPE